MMDIDFQREWQVLIQKLEERFGEGLELETVLFLIGVQELGQGHRNFKKHEKLDLMHIAICRLLEPYGYYEFDYFDQDGWPHYKVKETLPPLKAGQQTVLMKEAIVQYFLEKEVIQ
jgi:hypothetical protein